MQLRFDSSLYSGKALRDAAKAFAEHARVTMTRRGGRWIVRLEPKGDPPPPKLPEEYANYALGLTIRP